MRLRSLLPLAALFFVAGSLLAQGAKPPAELRWDAMDLGPFQSGTFKVGDQITAKGIALKVGTAAEQGTVLFDTELLRWSAAWTGGFIKFPPARGGLEGQITPDGQVQLRSGYAPGWALAGEIGDDPRDRHQGHLPAEVAKYRGLQLQGTRVIVSYNVGKAMVRETANLAALAGAPVFERRVQLEPSGEALSMLICDLPGAQGEGQGAGLTLSEQGQVDPASTAAIVVAAVGLPEGAKLRVAANGRAVLDLPVRPQRTSFLLRIWSGMKSAEPSVAALAAGVQASPVVEEKAPKSALWGPPLESKGVVAAGASAYLADEIPFPEENPFHSWFRPGGHDFLPDGRAVVASLSGDVWMVSGLDAGLEHVRWKRFATGLFQPLGVRVVGNDIYVLGRDQITRLHEESATGEAAEYACFNNDCVVTENYHEFALDLQTDRAGNFYYAKGSPWQPTVQSPHQGTLLKFTPDGAKLEIVATGLRAPNGMSIGPNDEITISDNQGHWMPSNRLNIIKTGGFYGMVPAAHRPMTFEGKEGDYTADPSSPRDQALHKQNFWGSIQTPVPRGSLRPAALLDSDADRQLERRRSLGAGGEQVGAAGRAPPANELRQMRPLRRAHRNGERRGASGAGALSHQVFLRHHAGAIFPGGWAALPDGSARLAD